MRETIWLVVSPSRVERMTKKPPSVNRGEIAVKVNLEVPLKSFRPPVIERTLLIEDWRDGTELEDVHLRNDVITEEEAKLIVERRLARMAEILRERGYSVSPEPATGDEVPDGG